MKMFVTVTALVLTGAAVSGDAAVNVESDAIEDSDIDISIGRLGVINERTGDIWRKLRSDDSSTDRHNLRVMNYELRSTVWEYNQLREDLCNDRFMVEQSCGAPYVPKWVFESRPDATTLKELEARQEDLADHVVPLWDAACKRLEKVISNEDWMPYCSIE